ncbi:hypothetical protein SASPL_121830 [Salvia splendens]|uniref:ubiquitinyl hydrolase 1 n=1 Tax=Salvia splendens TaxID=180675 RepID=A0A8X8ZWJ7_SALSN|nr:hypothetical protein SASPL_121830 [Salvia splendens]
MLKLAAVIAGLGQFRPVVLTPEFIHRRISPRIDGVLCLPLPDGLEGGVAPDFFAVERAMEETMPPALEELLREMAGGVACVEVARRSGVAAAGFWPAMHATYRLVAAIPDLIRTGVVSENGCPRNPSDLISLSSHEPTLTTNDLPWLIGSSKARVSRFKFWTRTIERSKTLQYIMINTFSEGSDLNTEQSTKFDGENSPQILEIGPLIMQAATTTSTTLWEEDTSCLDWLDKQNVGSVMYISFGSWVRPIGEVKVNSLASTLEALGMPFIWVVGPAWRLALPEGFIERVATYGRVVEWAPQLEVLQHPAVKCYLTHRGWNSTMEAIQCKKPLLFASASASSSSSLNSSTNDTEDDHTIAEILAEEEKLSYDNRKLGKRLSHLDSIPVCMTTAWSGSILGVKPSHTPRVIGDIPDPNDATLDHERLAQRLATYSLAEMQIEGDGNCQFRALADQLYQNPDYHKFVRKQVIKQLKRHRRLYESYVPMRYKHYVKKMKRLGEWGDHVTLQAAADRFEAKICLITSFRDTGYIEILPNDRSPSRGKTRLNIIISYDSLLFNHEAFIFISIVVSDLGGGGGIRTRDLKVIRSGSDKNTQEKALALLKLVDS